MSNLDAAFSNAPSHNLTSRVKIACQNESLAPLFSDISNYIIELKREIGDLKRKLEDQNVLGEEPAAKKRKLPIGLSTDVAPSGDGWFAAKATFTVYNMSWSIPVRKRLATEIVAGDSSSNGGIRMQAPSDGDQGIAVSWADIEQVICVPVPEKAQPVYQFIVIPQPNLTSSYNAESLMWTVPSVPAQENQVATYDPQSGAENKSVNSDYTLDLLVLQTINTNLQRFHKSITLPSPNEFTSALTQPHRKHQSEKAYHVKAFRGSKDGFLYFLPTGILFTPRKPLLFFPFSAITSISYSSVLQRTFNLNICARISPSSGTGVANTEDAEETEFEFAMLDQADYTGIDAYIQRHGLHDASLAESRRAKVYNVNAGKTATAATANGDPDDADINGTAIVSAAEHTNGAVPGIVYGAESEETSAFARAEQELQDAEDAEEEDYDPSGGESEGSGSESEDDYGAGEGEDSEEVEPLDDGEENNSDNDNDDDDIDKQ